MHTLSRFACALPRHERRALVENRCGESGDSRRVALIVPGNTVSHTNLTGNSARPINLRYIWPMLLLTMHGLYWGETESMLLN